MTTTNAERGDSTSNDLLARLVVSQAITPFQADWLAAICPDLDADTFAHPYLRAIPEHSRALLEREARSQCPR
jgi:hypothetical protein